MWKTLLLNQKHISYEKSLGLMRALVDWKRSAQCRPPQVLMLTAHEPVVTLGRRSGQGDLAVSEQCLVEKSVGVYRIERGGLATYHGPGQLVVYPVFDLYEMKLGVVQLVSGLEQAVIKTLAVYGIEAESRPDFRGVWVGEEKVASVGISVRRGISFHGMALNYATDLTYFDLIHPCGIPNVRMTSIAKILNQSVDDVHLRSVMAHCLSDQFRLTYEPITLNGLKNTIGVFS